MTQEETENLQWRVAPEIEVGEKCSHGHKNQYSESKQEKNIRFLWLEHRLDIYFRDSSKKRKGAILEHGGDCVQRKGRFAMDTSSYSGHITSMIWAWLHRVCHVPSRGVLDTCPVPERQTLQCTDIRKGYRQ